jgi:hypothetical protein
VLEEVNLMNVKILLGKDFAAASNGMHFVPGQKQIQAIAAQKSARAGEKNSIHAEKPGSTYSNVL